MRDKIIVEAISTANQADLADVYKKVFSGAPWYEEKVCSGARLPEGDSKKCSLQYTSKTLPSNYHWKANITNREGVIGETDFNNLEKCVACGRNLIDFYPDFINQKDLIEEAINKLGFVGYMLRDKEQKAVGFSWGYKIPLTRTKSVNFPKVIPILRESGVDIDKVFYGSELGVVDDLQGRGLGLLVSSLRLNRAKGLGYKQLLVRTKNEAVLSILKRVFSGQTGKNLFFDPEKGSSWFMYEFNKFDEEEVQRIIKLSQGE